MTGTFINVGTILLGGILGLAFGARLPDRIRNTVVISLGLFTAVVGISMFIESTGVEGENPLIPLVGLLIGGILGEWLGIERWLTGLGAWLEVRFAGGSGQITGDNRFIRGFLSASLLFCVGPMTVLGAIQDGLTGNYELLAIKAVLDGFASLALASTLGVGVMFSILVVLVYQGGLSLIAIQAQSFFSENMLAELSAVGGVLLVGLAIGTLLELRPIRIGNLLPALLIAPAIVFVLERLPLG
jgi:uncharacterized membrane protein YqgA involved in biofilm formation